MVALETDGLDNDRKISEFSQIPVSRVVGDDIGERQGRMKKAWRAYLGELPPPIRKEGRHDDNVVVNPAAAIVNVGVHFLFGSGLTWAGDFDNAAPPPWFKTLQRCWKANKQETFLLNLGLSGGINGHCFIRFVPGGAGYNKEYTRLVILDPANVDVKWDAQDYEQVREFAITTTIKDQGKEIRRVERITPTADGKWSMTTYEKKEVRNFLLKQMEIETQVGPTLLWNYPWPPIAHCQNLPLPNTFWGLSDLEKQVIGVISAMQMAMSNLNKILRIHASPKVLLKGITPDLAAEVDVSPDGMISLPDPEGDIKVLEMLSNLDSSLKFVESMRMGLYQMTQTPKIALGEADAAQAQMSGVSATVLYGPLIQKTESKQRTYGDMLLDVSTKLLILDGYGPEETESLRIEWPVPIPGSKFIERQTLQQDQILGASNDTILSKLGYDPRVERTNRKLQMEEAADSEVYKAKALAPLQQVSKAPGTTAPATPGGNNNAAGKGNVAGSMGGVSSAGTTRISKGGN
jgi:hypothetical protein